MTIHRTVDPEDWERLPLTGERYLPWSQGLFRKSGLLIVTNAYLFAHGMQAIEVWSDHDRTKSLGFDVQGTGRYPMPPKVWSNPDMIEMVERMRLLLAPALEGEPGDD